MAAEARWRPASPECFSFRRFDDELVVFDERSGNTHLLTGDAARVFSALRDAARALSQSELATLLRAAGFVAPQSQLDEVLELLASSELVERESA